MYYLNIQIRIIMHFIKGCFYSMNKFSIKFTVLPRFQELVKIHLCTPKNSYYKFLKWRASFPGDVLCGEKKTKTTPHTHNSFPAVWNDNNPNMMKIFFRRNLSESKDPGVISSAIKKNVFCIVMELVFPNPSNLETQEAPKSWVELKMSWNSLKGKIVSYFYSFILLPFS